MFSVKLSIVAETMNDKGKVLCFDIYENRVSLIVKGAQRLGLKSIIGKVGDASVFNSELGLADKVLCDVPCSGLGIIRRKPEIKYKSEAELSDLPDIQYAILDNASEYVKKGGRMIYSTCTLSKAENEDVVEKRRVRKRVHVVTGNTRTQNILGENIVLLIGLVISIIVLYNICIYVLNQ